MRRQLLAALAVGMVLAPFGAGGASAQSYMRSTPNLYGRGYRPLLNPYLNLLRGGDPAVNYYLGTLPEIQRRQQAQLFRQEIDDLERKEGVRAKEEEEPITALSPTGAPASFGNTKLRFNDTAGYFPPVTLPPGVRRVGQR
jgi:hypothetical protein